jgi:ATP-dependent 26S proteasome regulatory subunit
LGQLLLEEPITEVSVSLRSDKEEFGISAKIKTEDYYSIGQMVNLSSAETESKIIDGITKQYPNAKKRGKKIFLNGNRGTNFSLGRDTVIGFGDAIKISTVTDDYIASEEDASRRPLEAPEKMNDALEDLADVLKVSIESVYNVAGKTPPDETLILRPPKKEPKAKVLWEKTKTATETTKISPELLGKIKIEKPKISLDDIGGQKEAKEEIDELISAISDPDSFNEWGTRPPKGILFWGPPGTGKTLLAKALASSSDAQFFHVKASDLAKKYVGEAEKILENIFNLAGQSEEKTIIFFDEVDAIMPKREDAPKSAQGTISTLLENMDGIQSSKKITFVAATNRLEHVEPAFVRPGRIDRLIEVGLPDKEEREQIFNIHMRLAQESADAHFEEIGADSLRLFGTFDDFKEIIDETEKTSGADIHEIIRRSLAEKVRQKRKTGKRPPPVSKEDILKQIKKYERTKKAKEIVENTDWMNSYS